MDFRDSELVKMLVRDGLRAGSVGADQAHGMKMGARNAALHPELRQAEESADLKSGEKDAGRNRRQFTGGDVKQMRRCREVKFHLIVNPNHMAQAMPTADMRQTTQKPTRIAPRGVVSLMLVVDNT